MDSPRRHPHPRQRPRSRSARARSPLLEPLEGRIVLFNTNGGSWSNPAYITYSFIPDGTSIGGIGSNLFASMNAKFSTAAWQKAFQDAAAVWEAVAGVNVVQVSDSGAAVGVAGNQQGDARFGDVRIGGYAQGANVLALAYSPPPLNGGTNAGDMFFNTTQNWQVNGTTYDLETVAIHEFGHALGLSHSGSSSADMYYAYTSAHNALNGDDASGSQSIYSGRAKDQFEAAAPNGSYATASDITGFVNGAGQAALAPLDITGNSYIEYFKVVVPSSTTGTLTVTAQSLGLSSLDPKVAIMNAPGVVKATASGPAGAYGATVSVSWPVTAGQSYVIRVQGVSSSPSTGGDYGLQVNFGSGTMSPFPSPVVAVPSQPDQGGGSQSDHKIRTGAVAGDGDAMMALGAPDPDAAPPAAKPVNAPAAWVGPAESLGRLKAVDTLIEGWRREHRRSPESSPPPRLGPHRRPTQAAAVPERPRP